jgi:hypothetical protein
MAGPERNAECRNVKAYEQGGVFSLWGTSKNLQRMARMTIVRPDNLPAGRQGRDEERILNRSIQLRSLPVRQAGNEVWPDERHAPGGSAQSADDAEARFFEVPCGEGSDQKSSSTSMNWKSSLKKLW